MIAYTQFEIIDQRISLGNWLKIMLELIFEIMKLLRHGVSLMDREPIQCAVVRESRKLSLYLSEGKGGSGSSKFDIQKMIFTIKIK